MDETSIGIDSIDLVEMDAYFKGFRHKATPLWVGMETSSPHHLIALKIPTETSCC